MGNLIQINLDTILYSRINKYFVQITITRLQYGKMFESYLKKIKRKVGTA